MYHKDVQICDYRFVIPFKIRAKFLQHSFFDKK